MVRAVCRKSDSFEEERKRKMQADFRARLRPHVDRPRAGGADTSNDGNTRRRSFADPSDFSDITGVDQELTERLGVILEAIDGGQLVDVQTYAEYALETAQHYVHL